MFSLLISFPSSSFTHWRGRCCRGWCVPSSCSVFDVSLFHFRIFQFHFYFICHPLFFFHLAMFHSTTSSLRSRCVCVCVEIGCLFLFYSLHVFLPLCVFEIRMFSYSRFISLLFSHAQLYFSFVFVIFLCASSLTVFQSFVK